MFTVVLNQGRIFEELLTEHWWKPKMGNIQKVAYKNFKNI